MEINPYLLIERPGISTGHSKTKFSAQRGCICPRGTEDGNKGQGQIEDEGGKKRNKGDG